MKKHFVTFYSPGTFFSEQTTKEIDSWDTDKALKMAKKIKERYNASPYGFTFSTRERSNEDFDSKETKTSGMYYFNVDVLTLKQIKDRNDPKDKILISNMEGNGYKKVVQTKSGWKATLPLSKKDIVLEGY